MNPNSLTFEQRWKFLQDVIVDFVLSLAGWTLSTDMQPLDRDQLTIAVTACVASTARNLPEYDDNLDITELLELGVATYAEAVAANAAIAAENLEKLDPGSDGIITEGAYVEDDDIVPATGD